MLAFVVRRDGARPNPVIEQAFAILRKGERAKKEPEAEAKPAPAKATPARAKPAAKKPAAKKKARRR